MIKTSSQLLETSRVAEESVIRSYALFRWAVVFISVIVLFIVALEGMRIVHDYRHAFETASNSANNLTRAAAQHAQDAVSQVDSMLAGVRERVEGDGLASLDKERLTRLFTEQVGLMAQLHGLVIFDEHGHRVASNKNNLTGDLDVSAREYFRYHKSHADRGLRLGQVIISHLTGEPVIPLSRRLDKPDGSFGGVLLGALRTRYFSDYYAEFKIDAQGVFVLALRDGQVLVRRPALEGVTDISLARGEVYQNRLPYSSEGEIQMTSLVDNQPRLFGYKALNSFPLVIEVGISTDSIIRGWQRDLLKTFIIVIVMLIIIAAFSYFFLQQLRSRIVMAEALHVAHAAVQELAMRDGLTGLGNRRLLDSRLEEEVARATRSALPLGLILLDIDYFKRFNDRYGHPEGDACLRRVADAILSTLRRPSDLAARYGGEEIAILLADTDAVGAGIVAEEILTAIRGLDISHANSPFARLTASAGVSASTLIAGALTPEALIKAADEALYMAKQNGRDQWQCVSVPARQ
jgi:diguanylate cyclase (GGDEF)-like protein